MVRNLVGGNTPALRDIDCSYIISLRNLTSWPTHVFTQTKAHMTYSIEDARIYGVFSFLECFHMSRHDTTLAGCITSTDN